MLSPNDHDYYKIIYCTILYIQSHNCISNIFCHSFLYESCVSIKFISSSSSSSSSLLIIMTINIVLRVSTMIVSNKILFNGILLFFLMIEVVISLAPQLQRLFFQSELSK